MPKYTYKCESCHSLIQKYTSVKDKTIKCLECQSTMNRLMPKLRGLKTTETIDKFTNKKHIQDQGNILKERKSDHYWNTLVPEMVDSGIYTIETMIEQGWVSYNEKGQLVTNTKPLEKR